MRFTPFFTVISHRTFGFLHCIIFIFAALPPFSITGFIFLHFFTLIYGFYKFDAI